MSLAEDIKKYVIKFCAVPFCDILIFEKENRVEIGTGDKGVCKKGQGLL